MVIPDKVNFLQLGRYGKFSEQTYRNHFEKDFDWFEFNKSLIKRHLTGKRKAIAIDPSYIPKSGKKTPWIGYFWSGCATEYKRGLEIMGIGVKRRGHPKWYDGAVDFEHLDLSRCCEFATDKGKLYGLRAYSKALKRFVSLAIWYQDENKTNKW